MSFEREVENVEQEIGKSKYLRYTVLFFAGIGVLAFLYVFLF